MSITAIRLKNFRGFRKAEIQLKPLTVLLGPNSAGKSAFGHALAAMAHAHKYYGSGPQASLTPPAPEVNNWPVDLGETNDLRTNGADGPVLIGLETSGGWVELGFGGLPESITSELLISYIDHPTAAGSSPSGAPARTVVGTLPEGALSGVVVPQEPKKLQSVRPTITIRRRNEIQWHEDETEAVVILGGLVVRAIQHRSGTERPLSTAAINDLNSLFKNLTYLRATRKRPLRGYPGGEGQQQPIGYSGEYTPSILLKKGSNPVTYLEPPQIPNSVDEARTIDKVWKVKQEPLVNAVGAWLSKLGLARVVEPVPPTPADNKIKLRLALEDQALHDITEIGFGVSQVIPVLVAGLLQPEDSLFVVDLPEAHLHPRPQGAIADFFCSLAQSKRYAIVETHSEMFFHRLRLRAAMDPSLMEKIAVYFIDRPKDGVCCEPRLVGLGFEDELRWPEGFLEESWETAIQINAIRQARGNNS